MNNEFLIMTPQGWVCPTCGRVYSPYTPMCYYCGGEQKTITYPYTITYTTSTENVETAKMNKHAPQKRCYNCVHFQSDGYFCGYESHSCKIHGNIEACNHPHHDGDGSKCEDYRRKE